MTELDKEYEAYMAYMKRIADGYVLPLPRTGYPKPEPKKNRLVQFAVGACLALFLLGPLVICPFLAWYMDDGSWLWGMLITLILGLAG
jgi:hypothetical protein